MLEFLAKALLLATYVASLTWALEGQPFLTSVSQLLTAILLSVLSWVKAERTDYPGFFRGLTVVTWLGICIAVFTPLTRIYRGVPVTEVIPSISDATVGIFLALGIALGLVLFQTETRRYRGGLTRQPIPLLIRQAIIARDHRCCRYCARYTRDEEIDHILPIKLGGTNEIDNLVISCRSCNRAKRGRTPAQAGMRVIPLNELLMYL